MPPTIRFTMNLDKDSLKTSGNLLLYLKFIKILRFGIELWIRTRILIEFIMDGKNNRRKSGSGNI
jgi:hypothetical protein